MGNVVDLLVARLATSLNVAADAISIRVVSASVRIIVEITTPPGATAAAVAGSLTTVATQGAAQASTFLGITVQSVSQPTIEAIVLPAPSPSAVGQADPPPSPPTAAEAEPAARGEHIILIFAALGGGGGGLLVIVFVLMWCWRARRNAPAVVVGSAAATLDRL